MFKNVYGHCVSCPVLNEYILICIIDISKKYHKRRCTR